MAYEVEKRIPVVILKIEYNYLSLDSEGRIDACEQEKARRMAVDLFPPVLSEKQPGQVIDAQHRFAKKRYDNEYRWTPSPELEAAIVRTIFGKNGFFLSRRTQRQGKGYSGFFKNSPRQIGYSPFCVFTRILTVILDVGTFTKQAHTTRLQRTSPKDNLIFSLYSTSL